MAPSRCTNMKTYSNDTFHAGSRERRCNDLEARVPSFTPFLVTVLRQCKIVDPRFILTEHILTHALANASTMLRALLGEDSKRAVYELSCEIAANIFNHPKDEEELPIDTTEIQDWISKTARNDQNVVFKCTFLVDVETCDTQCDFQTAAETCFTFSSQSFASHNELLVSVNHTSCEYSAIIDFYVASPRLAETNVSLEPQCCVVVGCPVIHAETSFKNGQTFTLKNKRSKTYHTITGLCSNHYSNKNKYMNKHIVDQ